MCRALSSVADHLFTTRAWTLGSAVEAADADWQAVAEALNVDLAHLIRVRQVHGHAVVVHRAGDSPTRPDADVIISADPLVALAIQAADCVPLLLADARTGAVAAAHAGWRGLAARVPSLTVEALMREVGSRPDDLIAAVGPSIGADRYEVGAVVRARFQAAAFPPAQIDRWFRPGHRPEHWYFDLWRSTRDQLEAAGLPPPRVHVAELCTASHPGVLCSYRRDRTDAGRMAAAIRARTATPG